jgi:5-methylcytosine-specific restriction endonuclease McrA
MVGVVKIQRRKSKTGYGKDWNKTAKADRTALNQHRCQSCGTSGSRDNPLNRHHTLPVTRGGPNNLLNLVIKCEACHMRGHRRR